MYLSGTKYLALSLGCILSLSALAKNTMPAVGQDIPKPLLFIENKGQFTNQHGQPLTDVQFSMSSAGMSLYAGSGSLHYQFRKLRTNVYGLPETEVYRMDVTLEGANKHAKVVTGSRQNYFEQYYNEKTGPDGILAHSYNEVTFKEIYPGIDWVLYVKNGNVEYDFVVHPGADASQIKLRYDGATALNTDANGGIVATTPMGTVREKKPVAWETASGKPVAAAFQLNGNVLSFATGKTNKTLTIDPVILWSTYFGGTGEDVATCVRSTTAGTCYVGGYTASTGLSLAVGAPFNVLLGSYDGFLSRYDAVTGARAFTTYYGGAGNDRVNSLTTDGAGNAIYIAGQTTGSAGLSTAGAYRTANSGSSDGFLARFTNAGARTWGTYYGGTGVDYVNSLTMDAAGNLIVTGRTESATLISTGGAFQTALAGTADAFVAKFSNAGAITFSSYYGGTGVDEGYAVTTDAANNIFVTGQTTSIVNIATTGAFKTTLSGTNDVFVGRLNAAGNTRAWGTYFGGTGTEQPTGITCRTATGDVFVTGNTTSTTGIASAIAQQATFGGGAQDAFVVQFANAGGRRWSTYLGGTDLDYAEAIHIDPLGNVMVAGATLSNTGISTPGSLQPTSGGNFDAFIAKYSNIGQKIWGTYFGGALNDHSFGIFCDAANQTYFAGRTASTAGISTAGAAQAAFAGGSYDAFITRMRVDTFALINQPFTDTLICVGGTLTLPYTVNLNYRAGNVFTAQLSNATGSFAAPINIGTLAATGSGVITCTIPVGTPVGTGYRIRITGSAPAYISPDNFINIRVVNSLPAVTLTANSPVCLGSTLNLTSSATWSISSYNWAGPNSFASATANPTRGAMTVADAGVYSLTTTHNGCPANVSTINVLVNTTIPAAPVGYASTLNCNGGTLFLYTDTGATIPGSYNWSGPASFTSTLQFPSISPVAIANGGVYSVTSTVDGCTSPATTVNVTVTPNTVTGITISVSPNDTVCGGTMLTFNSIPVNAGVSPMLQWFVNGSAVVGAGAMSWSTATLHDGDVVTCNMTSNALCPAPATATSNPIKMNVIEDELLVYIFATPGTSVNPGDSIVFSSTVYNAGVGATMQWQRNGNDIPGATNATYTLYNVTVYDTIRLVVSSVMPCVTPAIKVSNALVAHPNTGITPVYSGLASVIIMPNPNNGTFAVKGEVNGVNTNSVTVSVMNSLGQVVMYESANVANRMLNKNISINDLAPGMYLLRLSGEGINHTERFSVQH